MTVSYCISGFSIAVNFVRPNTCRVFALSSHYVGFDSNTRTFWTAINYWLFFGCEYFYVFFPRVVQCGVAIYVRMIVANRNWFGSVSKCCKPYGHFDVGNKRVASIVDGRTCESIITNVVRAVNILYYSSFYCESNQLKTRIWTENNLNQNEENSIFSCKNIDICHCYLTGWCFRLNSFSNDAFLMSSQFADGAFFRSCDCDPLAGCSVGCLCNYRGQKLYPKQHPQQAKRPLRCLKKCPTVRCPVNVCLDVRECTPIQQIEQRPYLQL